MQRSTDRILTTHVGSLPRPAPLFELLAAKDSGSGVDAAALERLAAEATRDIVRKQIDAGVDIVNDGEMSKMGYSTYVKDRLNGYGGTGSFPGPAEMADFPDYAAKMRGRGSMMPQTPACIGPVSWKDRTAVHADIARLRAALAGTSPRDTFMTAASPGVIALFLDNQYYASHEQYLDALVEVMREEYEAIAAAGFVLQLDCPDLGVGRHSRFAKAPLDEFLKIVEMHVDAINRAVANIPAEQVRIHLCWGNYGGPHTQDVPLKDIIGAVLSVKASAISFEGANPRHEHEWNVFETVKLPAGKAIVPGVLDTSTNYVEHPELVAQRIVRYAQLVGRENVIAGSDCGFSTFASADPPVAPTVTWAKLRALAEGAKIASQCLWK